MAKNRELSQLGSFVVVDDNNGKVYEKLIIPSKSIEEGSEV